MPRLSENDIYKFMVDTLLKNNISAQTIMAIGSKIITHNKQYFKDHKMGKLKLGSFFLSQGQQTRKARGNNTCVLNFVWDQCRGKRGFRNYT